MGDQPTILLVDDDDEVRDGLVEFLRQQGYCIVVGSNEEESIQQATAQDFSIRLILVNQQIRITAMALLILIVTLRSWTQLGLTTFVPFFYLDVLDGDRRMVGPILFIFLGAGAVGTLVGGRLADRWGPRQVILYAFLSATPLIAGFLLTRGLLALALLAGAGFMLVSTFTVSVVLAQAYLPRNLGMAAGLIVGFAIGTGGIGVAGLGWVADRWGLFTALGVTAGMPLLGFLAACLLPEPPRD